MEVKGSPVANEHCKIVILVNFMRTMIPKTRSSQSSLFQIYYTDIFFCKLEINGLEEDHIYALGCK